jgi:hypothetical protein
LFPIGELTRQLSNTGIIRRAQREELPLPLVKAKCMNEKRLFLILDVPSYSSTIKTAKDRLPSTSTSSSGYLTNSDEVLLEHNSGMDSNLSKFKQRRNVEIEGRIIEAGILMPNHNNREVNPDTGFYREDDVYEFFDQVGTDPFPSYLSCLHHMPVSHSSFEISSISKSFIYLFLKF